MAEATGGASLVATAFDGGGDDGDAEAPNIGGDNAVPTSGIRAGFDSKAHWQRARRGVSVVIHAQSEVQSVQRKFKRGPAFFKIVRSNFRKAVVCRPELYLEASFEVFLFMVACSWITTCWFNPDILFRSTGGNRINDIFSYNNVCVGFDTAPARYVAQPLFALQSFLGIRFGNLDLLRLNLESAKGRVGKWQFYFSALMDLLFMGTMLLWPMLLIITPDSGGTGLNYHFYVYVTFVVIMYLTVLAQFTDGGGPTGVVPLISKIWVSVFGLWTFLLLLIGFIAFNAYDYARCPSDLVATLYKNGSHAEFCHQDATVPVALMSMLDYGWFALLLFATPLLPYSPALNIPITLVIDDNAKPVGKLANINVAEKAKQAAEATRKAATTATMKASKLANIDVADKAKQAAEATRKAATTATMKARKVKGHVHERVKDYTSTVSAV